MEYKEAKLADFKRLDEQLLHNMGEAQRQSEECAAMFEQQMDTLEKSHEATRAELQLQQAE